jgi:hypothetical protein
MKLVLAGDVSSSTLVNAVAGQPLFVILCQDGAGGHNFAAPANLQWNTVAVQDPNFCTAQGFVSDGATAFNLSPRKFVVRGSISGLTAAGLTLQLNGGTAIPIPSGATSFQFPSTLVPGQSYSVTIANQPASQFCTLSKRSQVDDSVSLRLFLSRQVIWECESRYQAQHCGDETHSVFHVVPPFNAASGSRHKSH